MPALVYVLCLLTSGLCAVLLLHSWRRTRMPLLFFSGVAFVFLALNNALVLIDAVVLPERNLLPFRHAAALIALSILIYGFIWEVDK